MVACWLGNAMGLQSGPHGAGRLRFQQGVAEYMATLADSAVRCGQRIAREAILDEAPAGVLAM